MRILLLTSAVFLLGVVSGPAAITSSFDTIDPLVTGVGVNASHHAQWEADRAMFKTCPNCIPVQPYPEEH